MKKGQRKTCTNIACPERRSVCCDAPCVAVTGMEGTGHYECANCQREFVGKACTAGKVKLEEWYDSLFDHDRELYFKIRDLIRFFVKKKP